MPARSLGINGPPRRFARRASPLAAASDASVSGSEAPDRGLDAAEASLRAARTARTREESGVAKNFTGRVDSRKGRAYKAPIDAAANAGRRQTLHRKAGPCPTSVGTDGFCESALRAGRDGSKKFDFGVDREAMNLNQVHRRRCGLWWCAVWYSSEAGLICSGICPGAGFLLSLGIGVRCSSLTSEERKRSVGGGVLAGLSLGRPMSRQSTLIYVFWSSLATGGNAGLGVRLCQL